MRPEERISGGGTADGGTTRRVEALRLLEVQVGVALDAGEMGAFTWDAATGALHWSERLERMAGLAPGSFRGSLEDLIALVHPDDRPRLREQAARSLAESDAVAECRLVRPDGEVRWLWALGRVVRGPDGEPAGVTGVVLDVTERRRAEQALRDAEERMRTLAESAPALVWMADASGACTYVNRAWLEFTGRSAAEELGDGWTEGIHPEDLERCLAVFGAAVAERAPFEMEYRLRHRDGGYRWILDRGSPIGSDSDVDGIVGVGIDVHERRLERERQRMLADVMAAVVAEVGIDGRAGALARLLSERVGDVCLVQVADEGAGRLQTAAARDRGLESVAAELRAHARLAHGEEPVLIDDMAAGGVEHDLLAARIGPAAAAALRARPPRSAIAAPLPARGRTLGGVLLLSYGDRRLGPGELALVEDICRRAALTIDNARLVVVAEGAAERLRLLQEATAALSSSATPEDVGRVAIEHARTLLRASAATVYEVEGDELVLLARDGHASSEAGRWARIPLDLRAPVTDAVRGRDAVWIGDRREWAARYPEHVAEAEARGFRGAAALPLPAGNAVVGAVALVFPGDRSVDPGDRDTARVLAEACGQALARARLQREAEVERSRAELAAEVSFALDGATGVEERLARLVRLLVPQLADLATIRLTGEAGAPSRLASVAHVDPAKEELALRLYRGYIAPPGAPGPGRVIATGRAELIADPPEEIIRAYAPDDAFAEGLRRLEVVSYMSVPLAARGAVLGALTAMTTTDSGRRYDEADLALAKELGRRAGLAIDNARIFEREQEARAAAERTRGRIERLQRVTAALAAAATEEEVARVVVDEAMGALSAVAGTVVLRDGDHARVLVAEGYPEDLLRPGLRFPVSAPLPLATVLRTGEELWLEAASDWVPRFGAPRPELRAAGIGLPLRIGTEVVGAIGFRFGQDERVLTAGDRLLARTLGDQLGQALERARLHEADRHAAEVLQRALLPARLPDPAAARLDVRYLPAAGGRSGGDFFDVVELDDGRLSLVVGDVVGHGVEAAAVMGQLRSAWRAFAVAGEGPAAVADRLSRFAEGVEGASVATVVCATLAAAELRWACAGHPPPVLRRPAGPAEYLMEGRGPPLGVAHGAHAEGVATLEPGSLVLFYTDGVVEQDRDLERGLAQLARTVSETRADPRELLARLAEEVGPEPGDDCALLALLVPDAPPPLELDLPARPASLREARARVRDWLSVAGVGEPDAGDVVLAASEALANSVEHAYSGRPGGGGETLGLTLERAPGNAVSVVVRDAGRWRSPPAEGANRGRGLRLMSAVMESVDVETGEAGTTVRMRRRIEPAPGPAAGAPPAPAPTTTRADDAVVRLSDELDDTTAPALAASVRRVAARGDSRLVIDLTDLRHLGSAGVRLLVELDAELSAGGAGRPSIVAPPGTIARRVLDLTGVAARLEVADREPDPLGDATAPAGDPA